MRAPIDLSLYLVLDPGLCGERGMVATALAAVAGGARVIQLRDKDGDTGRRIMVGRALLSALSGSGAKLIINDDVEAAAAIGADGVHVGQTDTAAAAARAQLEDGQILGVSVETEAAARAIDPAIVDYVGAGPVFATSTKPDHQPVIGFDGLARLVAAAPVPAVAIGGLRPEHAGSVIAAGAQGLAVVSAICGQPDPHAAARAFRIAIAQALAEQEERT